MKKQILIVFTGSMEIGGIETSLIGLLDSLDYSVYDVDLFLYGHHGPLYDSISPKVNILPEVRELAFLRESFISKIRNRSYYAALLRLTDQLLRVFRPVNFEKTWAKVLKRCAPALNKEYDLAIGFFRPFDYIYYKVRARTKAGWVHTDYSSFSKKGLGYIKEDYERLDHIVAVSEACKNSFISTFPSLADKMVVIENILSPDYIKEESQICDVSAEMRKGEDIILLSVGRFSYAKNFDNIPDICRKLIEKGLRIKWYLIGYGPDQDLIIRKIKEYGMEENVKILGKKQNPYPYMACCDVYVQPSRFEGKCVAVREAQILGKPVIITDYPTASSQIKNGIDGIIVPKDNQSCADGIAEALRNKALLSEIVDNLKRYDFSNAKEIKKIDELVQV